MARFCACKKSKKIADYCCCYCCCSCCYYHLCCSWSYRL